MKQEIALKIIWDSCMHNEKTSEAYKVLKNNINPQGEWIPVSERLPERDEIVIVSYKTGGVHLCKYLGDGSENPWWSYIDDCCAWNNVVNAWMPLPEPYKKGDKE